MQFVADDKPAGDSSISIQSDQKISIMRTVHYLFVESIHEMTEHMS
jgi:hypothetical protein